MDTFTNFQALYSVYLVEASSGAVVEAAIASALRNPTATSLNASSHTSTNTVR